MLLINSYQSSYWSISSNFSLQQLWASSVGHDACTKWPRLMGRGTGFSNLEKLFSELAFDLQICCCFLFLNKGRRKELSKGKQLLQGWPNEITFPFCFLAVQDSSIGGLVSEWETFDFFFVFLWLTDWQHHLLSCPGQLKNKTKKSTHKQINLAFP